MSYSLAIVDGDLARVGSRLDVVYGVDKLRQDIHCWLTERYGGDRFHVKMGSILNDFIGDIATQSARVEVQSEVLRILQAYQAIQAKRLKENPEKLSSSEMLVSIDDIRVTMSYDTIDVRISIRNGSGDPALIKIRTGA